MFTTKHIKLRFSLLEIKSRTKRFPVINEVGISTLEWILIVAAVGALATIGIIVVRGAVGDSDDRAQSGVELTGEDGQLLTIQNRVNQIFASMPAPTSTYPFGVATPADLMPETLTSAMSDLCENPSDFTHPVSFTGKPANFDTEVLGVSTLLATSDVPGRTGRLDNSANVLYEMGRVHADWSSTYTFHFIPTGQFSASFNSEAVSAQVLSLKAGFWCRVRSQTSGNCGKIVKEVAKVDPVDADFVNGGHGNRLCNNLV